MPKKKELGLGQGLQKIADLIDSLKKDLEKLTNSKIKEKLQSEKIYDPKVVGDSITAVKKEALELNEALGNLKDIIMELNKSKGNSSRFDIKASERATTASSIVRRFLEDST